MADLSFPAGSDPVCVFNDSSGNQLAVNSDGSINDNLAKVGGTAIALGQTTMAASVPITVASNQSAIPISAASLPLPTGAATSALQTTSNTTLSNIDTKTPTLVSGKQPVALYDASSGNQLVVNADGSINVSSGSSQVLSSQIFSCSFEFNLASAAELNFALFRNPAGSGKVVQIQRIIFLITNTTATQAIMRFYANPTVTGVGTTQTTLCDYLRTGAPASTSLVYSGPTTSAAGTKFYEIGTTGGSSFSPYTNIFDGLIALDPGRDVLITGRPDGTNRNVSMTMFWSEV